MKQIWLRIGLLLFVILVGMAVIAYAWIFRPNTTNETSFDLYIPSGATYTEVKELLNKNEVIVNRRSFDLVAKMMKYDHNVRPGRYVIPPRVANRQLIGQLRSGQQTPVNVTISTARTIKDVAHKVAKTIEADSTEIVEALMNPDLWSQYELDQYSAIALVIPNTYEFFWNTDALSFAHRLGAEYDRFWNDQRKRQLQRIGLNKREVSTLASIVEKESNLMSERPRMAGVYLNRLKAGIPLQADPTVVFGLGDFEIRRVLNKHLQVDTPYNTYIHKGLPPGPICMPSISSIDAVLNAESHDYLFFCAKPGYNNGHLFAKSNAQHARNARKYHRWLNSQGIKG